VYTELFEIEKCIGQFENFKTLTGLIFARPDKSIRTGKLIFYIGAASRNI
jgi:hypothetical protein